MVGFDFHIVYHPGRHNKAADALSRPDEGTLNAISVRTFNCIDEIRVATQSNPEMLTIKHGIEHEPATYSNYVLREELLFFKGILVIPSDSPILIRLLQEFHASPVGGHAGIGRSSHRLTSNFFWCHMQRDVKAFVTACQVCQQL